MEKKLQITAALFLLFLLAGCKSKQEEIPQPNPTPYPSIETKTFSSLPFLYDKWGAKADVLIQAEKDNGGTASTIDIFGSPSDLSFTTSDQQVPYRVYSMEGDSLVRSRLLAVPYSLVLQVSEDRLRTMPNPHLELLLRKAGFSPETTAKLPFFFVNSEKNCRLSLDSKLLEGRLSAVIGMEPIQKRIRPLRQIPVACTQWGASPTEIYSYETALGSVFLGVSEQTIIFDTAKEAPFLSRAYLLDSDKKLLQSEIYLSDISLLYTLDTEQKPKINPHWQGILQEAGYEPNKEVPSNPAGLVLSYTNTKQGIRLSFGSSTLPSVYKDNSSRGLIVLEQYTPKG